ncbi:MAG: TetR/AcrR family transcriptional regulator [Microbacteriaceae bacterium]
MSAAPSTPAAAGLPPRDLAVQARREQIVQAATTTFARLGFAGASLRELAAEAGIEKGHLTYYFSTKEELLFEIVDRLHRRFTSGIRVWMESAAAGDEMLLHIFEQHLRLVFESTAATRVAYDNFRFLSGSARAAVISQRADYEDRLTTAIDAARRVSDIDATPTRRLTKVVLAQLNWPYQWHTSRGRASDTKLARLLAHRALASIRPLELAGRTSI